MKAQPAMPWAVTPWFLTSPPQVPLSISPRERLLTSLDTALVDHTVAVVSAPSGYGKSVFLAEWARRHASTTAWLTLTRHDHGEALVLAGILSALSKFVGQAHGSPPRTAPTPESHADADVRTLIGRIAQIVNTLPEPMAVVIDDAQHAGSGIASDVVEVLTALTTGRLRFVLGGTNELLSWFSRTIAGQQTAVLTAIDLALTPEEILLDSLGTPAAVNAEAAAMLWHETRGWPIAVHLRRLAGTPAPSTTGPDALLTDYIAGNLLPRLSPKLADFILATTVCTRLVPDLAQALSGADDAESLLEDCVAQGLFLDRYVDDDGARVYRWHDEFAARCSEILTRTDASRRRALDDAAARWLAQRFPAEAVGHAIKADDPELAIDIIRSSWIATIVQEGARGLNALCLGLPASLAGHPEILLIRACCLNLLGDRVGAGLRTSQAIAADPGDAAFQVTRVFAMLFLADAQTELESAVDAARRLLEKGEMPSEVHAYCVFLLGWSELRLRRDPQMAVQLLESALPEAQAAHRDVLARRAATNLLLALSYAGNLARARTLIEDTSHLLKPAEDWHHYDGGIELFASGFTHYWQNRTEEAETAFRMLVDSGGHDGSYTALASVYLAFCAAADGRPAAVRTAHEAIAGVSTQERHGVPWPAYGAIARAVLCAASGDAERALSIIEPIRAVPNVPLVRVIAAELMRGAGRLSGAAQLLSSLSAAEMSISHTAGMAYVTAALIAHERDDIPRAHSLLERALNAAVPEGVIRPFSSADERLHSLLSQHASAGTAHEAFVAARIAELDSRTVGHVDLGSVLSTREREIYGYLCTTMTATEIGAALFISVNTIRTHQRAIYRKLGVTNRREAVRLRL